VKAPSSAHATAGAGDVTDGLSFICVKSHWRHGEKSTRLRVTFVKAIPTFGTASEKSVDRTSIDKSVRLRKVKLPLQELTLALQEVKIGILELIGRFDGQTRTMCLMFLNRILLNYQRTL
jgi:hypothetical protein